MSIFRGVQQGDVYSATENLPAMQQNINNMMMRAAEVQANAYESIGKSIGGGIEKALDEYAKNKDEDEYVSENLKNLSAEGIQWKQILESDPKFAPLAQSLNEYLGKAVNGPKMSHNQKKALAVSLGSVLQKIPNQVQMIDMMGKKAEEEANLDARLAANLAQVNRYVSGLGNAGKTVGLRNEGVGIIAEAGKAGTRAEKTRALALAEAYNTSFGGNLALTDKITQEAAIRAGQAALPKANALVPVGKKGVGTVEGIPLATETNGKWMPVSPSAAITAFRKQVEAAKAKNPNAEISPDAEVNFVLAMRKAVEGSSLPEPYKQGWIKAIDNNEDTVGLGEIPMPQPPPPAAAPTSGTQAALQQRQQQRDSKATSFQQDLRPSTVQFDDEGKPLMTTKAQDLQFLQQNKGDASGLVKDLVADFVAENPNSKPDEILDHVVEYLREAGVIDRDGKIKDAKDKPLEAKMAELRNQAKAWLEANLPPEEAKKAAGKLGKPYDPWNDPLVTGSVAAAGTAAAVKGVDWVLGKLPDKYRPEIGVGPVGTAAYREKRAKASEGRVNKLIQEELELQKKERLARDTGDDAAYEDWKKNPNTNETPEQRRSRLARESEARAPKADREADIKRAADSPEGKAVLAKKKIKSKSGRPINIETLAGDNFERSLPNLSRRTGVSQAELRAARKELESIGQAMRTVAGRGKISAARTSSTIKKATGWTALGTGIILGGGYASDWAGTQTPTALKNYDLLYGPKGLYTTARKELEAEVAGINAAQTDIVAESQTAGITSTPSKTDAKPFTPPRTSAVSNVLQAEMYRAATHKETVDRTQEFINQALGFDYEEARNIALRLNPPSTSASVVRINDRDFLAVPDPKGGATTYKELEKSQDPSALWYGKIDVVETTTEDGSTRFVPQATPLRYSKIAITPFKWASDTTPAQKTEFNQRVESTNQTLEVADRLVKILESGDVRLIQRELANEADSWSILLRFVTAKGIGTPPISNVELEDIGRAANSGDINALTSSDRLNALPRLRALRTFAEDSLSSAVVSASKGQGQVVFLDRATAAESNDPVEKERRERFKAKYPQK